MSTLVLTDCGVHVGGYDLTTDSNKVTVEVEAEVLDATTFGTGGYHVRRAGLRSANFSHGGFQQFADPDSTLFADLAVERVFTVTPTGADGDVAYFANARRFGYTPIDGEVGQLVNFAGTGQSSDSAGLVRGRLLYPKQSVSGAGSGSGSQLGAVSSTARLFTSVHVFTAGTTADVIVESDDNAGFTSATTRSTTTVTAAGGTFVAPVNGAITDTYWRVRIANITGTFSLAVAVGIH